MAFIKVETCCTEWGVTVKIWVVNGGLCIILLQCINSQRVIWSIENTYILQDLKR